jgi:ribosomal-protein-alanine N-acetyltransferase
MTLAMPQIRTKRLLLKVPDEADAPAICRHLVENREHFKATDPLRAPGFYTQAYWVGKTREARQEFAQDRSLRLVICPEQAASQVIGTVNFTEIFRGAFQACYLGYALAHEHQGQGLMMEALQASIAYVFGEMNLHRIMANHLPENTKSANVLKRLGFVVEGRAEKYLLINGVWREHVLNALTNDHWKPQ